MNAKKTKIMDIKAPGKQVLPTDIHIGGHRIGNVDSFEYLGALIQSDWDVPKDIKRRLGMASQKLMK